MRVALRLTLANASRNSLLLSLSEGSFKANFSECVKEFIVFYLCLRVALRLTLANVSRNSLVLPLSEGSAKANSSECVKEFSVFVFV